MATQEDWRILIPLQTRHHLRAAYKENLLAIRALLDMLIGEEERVPSRAPAPSERAARPRAPRRRRRPPPAK